MKTKKTSQVMLNRYKKSFTYWQNRLGLHDWAIAFKLSNVDDNQAILVTSCNALMGTAHLHEDADAITETPENLGQHEAFHLLIASLDHLAKVRFVEEDAIRLENERIVNRLQRAFP